MCGFGLRLQKNAEREAIASIASMDAVSYLSLTLGRWDAIGTLLVKTQSELVSELDRVRATPASRRLRVGRTSTSSKLITH